MAAPERFAETSDSSCSAGAVHTWHFRAGGGAVHSIRTGLMHCSKQGALGAGHLFNHLLFNHLLDAGEWGVVKLSQNRFILTSVIAAAVRFARPGSIAYATRG